MTGWYIIKWWRQAEEESPWRVEPTGQEESPWRVEPTGQEESPWRVEPTGQELPWRVEPTGQEELVTWEELQVVAVEGKKSETILL